MGGLLLLVCCFTLLCRRRRSASAQDEDWIEAPVALPTGSKKDEPAMADISTDTYRSTKKHKKRESDPGIAGVGSGDLAVATRQRRGEPLTIRRSSTLPGTEREISIVERSEAIASGIEERTAMD